MPTSPRTMTRTTAHIKALLEELKADSPGVGTPVQLFTSGLLTGLSMSLNISTGSSAEAEMEQLATQLAAAIGNAYLDGALPADPADPVRTCPKIGCEDTHPHLHSRAEMDPVRALFETWVAAGPPPLGTGISRWWDKRLAELKAALNDSASPKEH